MIPKFRAWDRARSKMNYRVMLGNCDIDDETWTCPIIWSEDERKWLHFDDYECIMQSTGLKDKNGKEIFEGDIVQYQNSKVPSADSKGVIRYFDNWAMFGIDIEHNEPRAIFFNGLADHISLEVVGNIYENPELLE